MGFKLGGADVSEAEVPMTGVVEPFVQFEHGRLKFCSRVPAGAVQQLALHRESERLSERIVDTKGDAAHRPEQPCFSQ